MAADELSVVVSIDLRFTCRICGADQPPRGVVMTHVVCSAPACRAAARRNRDHGGWKVEVREVPAADLTLEALITWPGSLADLLNGGGR